MNPHHAPNSQVNAQIETMETLDREGSMYRCAQLHVQYGALTLCDRFLGYIPQTDCEWVGLQRREKGTNVEQIPRRLDAKARMQVVSRQTRLFNSEAVDTRITRSFVKEQQGA